MGDQATAKYLNDNIGNVLSKALAEMAQAQPRDGVGFLASWLDVYLKTEQVKSEQEQEEAKLKEERKFAQEQLAEQAAKIAAREEAEAKREKIYQDALLKYNTDGTMFEESCWGELLSVACVLTGAKAAYLGLVDEEGLDGEAGPLITYSATTPGSEFMLDKVLPQGAGVTWGAVTENPGEEVPCIWKPTLPEPVKADPDDPDSPLVEQALPPFLPVSVPCVTDVKEVHYFDMTRLGAYLAVPLSYKSYYSAEALDAAKAYEQDKKDKIAKQKEVEEKFQADIEEALASGGEEKAEEVRANPPEGLEPIEETPLELPSKQVRMVMCLDTLGTNTMLPESKIEMAMELTKALGKCKEETEKHQVDQQALSDIDQASKEELASMIEEVRARIEESTQEQQAAEEAEAEEEAKKDVIAKKWAYIRAEKLLKEFKAKLMELKSWVVVPSEVLNLFAATAYMYGYPKEQLYPKRKANMDWVTIRQLLGEKLLAAIAGAEVTEQRKGLAPEHKLAAIKALIPPVEKVKELSLALELLQGVLSAAVDYRTSHLMALKEAHAKATAEAAEAEEAAPPPLEDDDDDFEGL